MKYREVEMEVKNINRLSKKIACPICLAQTELPNYICTVCNSQIVFIPPKSGDFLFD